MASFPHLPTLNAAAAVSAAVAFMLLLTHWHALVEIRARAWIVSFMAMSLCFTAFALRSLAPEWVPIVVGNAFAWLSLATIWHGCRQLRGAQSKASLVPVPSLVWVLLCLVPDFYDSELRRIATASLFGTVLVTGATASAWISSRATGLASLRDVACLLGLFILYFQIRAGFAMFGLEWISLRLSGWYALVAATVIPYLLVMATRERATTLQQHREMDRLLKDRTEIDQLLKGLPAVVFLREIQPDCSSRMLYRGGDAARVTGWPREVLDEIDDLSKLAVNLSEEVLAGAYRASMNGDMTSLEYQSRLPDGGTKWLRATARVVERRPDGSALIAGNLTDIQDLRDAEARATNVARLASLGEMAVGLAHELRQPLAIVSMAAENTLDDIATGDLEGAEERMRRIIRQSQRASDIIDNLRRFAMDAREAGATGPVLLQASVERALILMGGVLHRGGIRVEQVIAAPSPVALAWPGALEQILVNLLSNAADALESRPAGTRLVRIEATTDSEKGTVRLMVADTGGGVAPEILPRLFHPFVTSKAADRGTGLGLAICHGMTKTLGGTITVENQTAGAAFTIILPAGPAPPKAEDEAG